MATYFGIDFGTTNCAVHAITAIGDGIDDEFDIGETDRRPLPSFVAIHRETGEVVTGLDAKGSIAEEDEYEVFSSIKTVIGEEREWIISWMRRLLQFRLVSLLGKRTISEKRH